jgi:hypothetical protein
VQFQTALVVLAIAATVPAAAHGQIASGPWRGEAFFKDARFTHCAMRANQGQWKVAFSMNASGAVNLGLHHNRLKYTKGTRLAGSLQIDADAPATYQFVAVSSGMVGARLGGVEAVEKFSRGSRLSLRMGEVTGQFSLSGAKGAFAQLTVCVAKRGGK